MIITYYKNQTDVAKAMIELIDKYWDKGITEAKLIEYLNEITDNNREKVFTQNGYTGIVQQRMGKKRLDLLGKVLKSEEVKK